MTVKLSELRVTQSLNASQYTAGMNAKVAADVAGTASSEKLGATSTQTYQKISQSGAVLERLSKQYVQGYAATAKFEQAIRMLGRGLETGNITVAEAGSILDGIYSKFGRTADSAAALGAGYTQLAELISQKSQQISTSTTLVARSLSSISTGMSVVGKQSLAVNEANARLVSGMTQFGTQLKATDAALVDVAAGMSLYGKEALDASVLNERLIKGMSGASASIDGTGKTAALSAYQLTNLSFQLNDVATQAALGVGPLRILASQGGQFFQILQTGAGGVRGSLSYLAQLIGSFVTPFRLATAAAAGFIAIAATTGVSWANTQSKIDLALTGIGHASGITVDSINRIAEVVSAAGSISESSAEDIATAIAATGRVSADTTQKITGLTKAYSLVFGKTLIDSANDLGQALADPSKSVDELNKRLAAFSDAEAQAIKRLDQAGNRSAAQKILTDGLTRSIGDAEAKTTGWARAWDSLSKAASDAATSVGKAVNEANGGGSLQDQLAYVQSQLQYSKQSRQQLVTGLQYTNPEDVSVPGLSDLTQLEAREKQLKQAIARDTQDAINAAQIEESGVFGNLIRQADPALSRLQEIDAAIKRIQADRQNWGIMGNVDAATQAVSDDALKNYKSEQDFLKSNIALAKQRFDINSAQLGLDARANDIDLAAINARTPAQKAEIEYRRTLLQYGNSADAQAEAELARARSLAQSQHDLSEAVRDRMYQNSQDIEQGQIQNDVIGRSVDVATRLTARFQLLAAAKAEAFKNGTTVSAQEELQALITADEKARQAVDAARKGLLTDLSFSNDQLGRSSIDQVVYSRMQSAGLLDNGKVVGAQNEAIAQQIRFNEQLQRSIDIEKGFASDFLSDVIQGKSAVEALGIALNSLAQKMLDNSLDTLFAGLKGAGAVSAGGLLGGNILPGILHAGGVVGSTVVPTRSVPLAAFNGAVRYHTGGIAGASPFKPGEMPAILQRGEIVLPRGSSAAGGAGVAITIPVTINAPGADAAALKRVEAAVSKLATDLRPTIVATVRDAKNRNLV
ncbi:phage tail length tape measure family protein [Hyphomicrobium sp. B1]|uniref:phage tail length tape measure family protein n=1 Tax=Hyphomicrobium sp. B1 TaxID=3075651 RepID=UPI003C2ACAE9